MLMKPFLEGKDLKRWRAEPRGLWLIYIPQRRVNIDDYPAIRDWLLPFKDKLEARATKQEWFELQQAQEAYSPFFQPPKIAYGHFQDQPIYSMETTGAYSNNKTYFIPNGDWDLLEVLNSKAIWFDFCSRTTAVRGGWREATAQHIEPLPMPPITDTAKTELSRLAEGASKAAQERLTLQTALKHRQSQKASREEIAALRGIIRQDREIGLFVSSGGFTPQAMAEARNGTVHIQLMDLDSFLENWMAYYDKLAEEDRALLRLRPVYFLSPN
ncbi:TaqI-like C-terminal specificity domain-containing protein [Marivita sp.]|uniref:TaqI-like C-terminal specificity domain-containing protein n=1 Tax=Marivita sp. TaxID=2003365 RepID=UPI003F6E5222